MARTCYALKLGENTYKLRLTLRGQKVLRALDPDAPILAAVVGAVDDPDTMEALLTEALNWKGNDNKLHDGAELYDEMVDNGYSGSEDFLRVVLNIAENAGLLTEAERIKVERSTGKLLRAAMENFDDEEEGEESPENPLKDLKTL